MTPINGDVPAFFAVVSAEISGFNFGSMVTASDNGSWAAGINRHLVEDNRI